MCRARVRKEVCSQQQDKWKEGEEIVSSQFTEFPSLLHFNPDTLPYLPGIVRPFPSVTAMCQPSAAGILEPGSSIHHCAFPFSQGLPTMSFLPYKTKKKYLGQELLL